MLAVRWGWKGPGIGASIRKMSGVSVDGSDINELWFCLFFLISLLQALVLYGEAVSRDLFPSLWQRSLYNEPGLRAMPWWGVGETGYKEELMRIVNALENITRCVCAYVYAERCFAFVYM